MDLRTRIRAASRSEHEALERSLDLLSPPLTRTRFERVLIGFWGFHAAWEPAVRRHAGLASVFAGRGRLELLRADLDALGYGAREIEALPVCAEAAQLAVTPEAAMGSLYVIEGSTLGGQLISRALREARWAAAARLRYFDPYGAETGARWRAFQASLEAASSPAADPLIEAGAVATFGLLRRWLTLEVAA